MMNNVENYIITFNTFTNHVISLFFDRMRVLMRSIHPSRQIGHIYMQYIIDACCHGDDL